MKQSIGVLLGFFLLGISVVRAEDKPPETMPRQAAQDLDYAVLKRQAKVQKFVKQFEKEIREATAPENKLIDELAKKYHLRLDDKGALIDEVDIDTGKITRATEKPVVEPPPRKASPNRTAKQ